MAPAPRAAVAAEKCRRADISEAELSLWDQNVRNCHEVLAARVARGDPVSLSKR